MLRGLKRGRSQSMSSNERRFDAIVIGSGIAAQTLSPHAVGLELFENAAATGVGLYVLILAFGAISGAHFNPIISFVDAMFGAAGAVTRVLSFGPFVPSIRYSFRCQTDRLFKAKLADARRRIRTARRPGCTTC